MHRLQALVRPLRRRVLVVDHRIPMPDQDAGSRTLFQVLSLFAAKRYKVDFWAPDRGIDDRYRDRLVAEGIRPHPLDPAPSARFKRWLKRNGEKIDVVFLSRPQMAQEVIDLIRTYSRARVLYYGHDLHHVRLRLGAAHADAADYAARADAFEAIENEVWRKVDTAFYPSPEECRYVESRCRASGHRVDARVLPVFGFDTFEHRSRLTLQARSGVLFVGGFGHSPNIDGLLWFVREVWPAVTAAAPGTWLTIVGARPPPEILALAGDGIDVRGFIPDEALEQAYRNTRIAVAPLRFGAGMKGKVAEAMRFGVPMVTTGIGAQGLEDAGDALLVADDPERQAELILALLRDDQLWTRTASAALRLARQRFSRQALWTALTAAM